MASFPLLLLPQELRDKVLDDTLSPEEYDFSPHLRLKTRDKDKDGEDRVVDGVHPQQANDPMDLDEGPGIEQQPPVGLRVGVRYLPDPRILRVNRALCGQYQKRANSWKTLVLTDSEAYNFHHVILPLQVTGVFWLELCLILFCNSGPFVNHECGKHCRAAAEISRHKSWIEDVLQQLSSLRAVTIFVHLAHSDFTLGQKTKLPCEDPVERKLQELKDLPKVKELILYRYEFEEQKYLDGPKDLVSRWKPETPERVDRASFR